MKRERYSAVKMTKTRVTHKQHRVTQTTIAVMIMNNKIITSYNIHIIIKIIIIFCVCVLYACMIIPVSRHGDRMGGESY